MLAKFSAFLLAATLLSSCETKQPAATAAPARTAPAAEARYECPMGCAHSQSAKPGQCPTCEMELVKKS